MLTLTTFYQEFDDPDGYVGDREYVPNDGFAAIGCTKLMGLGFQAVGTNLRDKDGHLWGESFYDQLTKDIENRFIKQGERGDEIFN